MVPDKTYELFYTIPMLNLRGGGDIVMDDNDSVTASDDEPMSDDTTNGTLTLRGGNLSGEVELWGLTGRTVVHFSHGLGSFFWAVDRLLALQSRSSADGSTGISVAVLSHPQGQRTPCEVLWDSQCYLGNRKREAAFLAELKNALRDIMEDIPIDAEIELCVSQISLNKHFQQTQTDLSYRPCLQDHQLASFSLENDPDGSLAYLFMPKNVNSGTAASHYQNWFKSIWRTLSNPHQGIEQTYTLGSSTVESPTSCFVRIVENKNYGSCTDYFHSDMGPPQEVWEWLVESYHERGSREFILDVLPPSDSLVGSTFHIPGYFRGPLETKRYESMSDMIQIAIDSVPKTDLDSLEAVRIRPLKFDGFVDNKGVYFQCQDDEGFCTDQFQKSESDKFQTWLYYHYPLSIQPCWQRYEAQILGRDNEPILTSAGKNQVLKFYLDDPWEKVLNRFRLFFNKLGLSMDNTVIRIDQRTTQTESPEDVGNRTRIRWDLEAQDTPEIRASWKSFLNSLRMKRVTVQLVSKTELPDQLSDAEPFALREQQPDKFYWGCHDHPDDVVVFHEGPEEMMTTTTTASATRQIPERKVDYERRTTGWEDPRHQAKGDNSLTVTREGIPIRGYRGVDDFKRGKIFREWSYGHPLSINMEGQYPEIPVNAPPLENFLMTTGPDGISDTVPMMSTQLMTATEQRRLQEAFFKMRSIALDRAQPCPYLGCTKYFPVDDKGMVAFRAHLKDVHVGTNCPFCSETLLSHWAPWQLAQHFLVNHADYFSRKGDLRRDLAVTIQSRGFVHRREEQFSFCPRCGRNHQVLGARADRIHHDNLCFPGNMADFDQAKYCRSCGEGYLPPGGVFQQPAHRCNATPEQQKQNMHCNDCGLPTHEFSVVYAHKHVLHCRGATSSHASWCPWCGIDVKLCSRVERHRHLDNCALKPATGENPINTSTGEPMDSPRDTPRHRRRKTYFKPVGNEINLVKIPKYCPMQGCSQDLSIFNADGLFTHCVLEHCEATGNGRECPFCCMDFEARGWVLMEQKTSHFEDHIDMRTQRIMADLEIAQATDLEAPEIQDAIHRRNLDERDKSQLLLQKDEELGVAYGALTTLREKMMDLQRRLDERTGGNPSLYDKIKEGRVNP